MDDTIKLFTVIVLVSLPTVMYGGFSLLQLRIRGRLDEFQMTYFRAGHAHAGVLLVLSLAALDVLARTDLGDGAVWTVCLLLAIGTIAQSGGMFLHMAVGRPGKWSAGNWVTTAGAGCLAAALLTLAYGVATT
jgi:heme/copper-type cytochrome/quinol oxidase subunit 4